MYTASPLAARQGMASGSDRAVWLRADGTARVGGALGCQDKVKGVGMQNEFGSDRGKEPAAASLSVPLRALLKRCYSRSEPLDSLSELVQGLQTLVDADRIALLRAIPTGRLQLIASHAGVVEAGVGRHSAVAEGWEALGERLLRSASDADRNTLLVEHARSVAMATAIAIPIHDDQPVRPGFHAEQERFHERLAVTQQAGPEMEDRGARAPGHAVLGSGVGHNTAGMLILEWGALDAFRANTGMLEELIPWVRDAIAVQLARPQSSWTRWWSARRWKWVAAGVMGLLLLQPIELWIEVDGSLQPTTQRFVFAPCDGYIEDFLARDGQSVRVGELLVRLNSPDLRLQRVQLESEERIVAEKRVSLEVSANQVSNRDESAAVMSARIAGELEELNQRRASIERQLEWLVGEEARLLQRAPIEGVVVTEPQWTEAQNRPVRRGDLIARIVSTEADWWVVGHVLDWESGYIADAWTAAQADGRAVAVQFTLATDARVIRSGRLTAVDQAFRNEVAGPSLDIRVEPSHRLPSPRVGATAKLWVPCGARMRWFVWSRTILDAIHRRFWV